MKNLLSFVLRFGLSAGLLIFIFRKIDLAATADIVRQADAFFLWLAFGTFVTIYAILLIRWIVFVEGLGLNASRWQVARFFAIGIFGNLFLPTAIGGDILKTVGLCHNQAEKPKVVASVLLDRLSGFAGIALTALVMFPFAPDLLANRSIVVMVLGMAAAIIGLSVVLFNERIYSFFCLIFERLPRFKKALMRVHYDAALLKGKRSVIYQAVFLSCIAQFLLALTFWLVGLALRQEVAFIYYMIFIPIICVATSIPSVGGLGVREAGAAFLFTKVGMAAGVAVSISLMNFVYMTMVGSAGGLFFLFSRPSMGKMAPDSV